MRKLIIASAAAFALAGVAACNSPADNTAEQQGDALENQADAAPTEAEETALNAEAEQQAGNADGGLTTENTPNTSPSAPAQ